MTVGHEMSIDTLSSIREDQRRWWRLSFLCEEVEWAQHHVAAEVADARDAGWSWRRLAAATGIPAETLRLRYGKEDADARATLGEPPAATGRTTGGPARLR